MSDYQTYSFAAKPEIETDPSPEADLFNLTGQRCLVVDAVPDMRNVLSSSLTSFGADRIEQVGKATQALGQMRRIGYDIVLSEYDLGHGQDGLFLFEEAKRYGLIKASCIFIIVTGERRAQKVMSAAELVPDAIVLKPFTNETLMMRLAKALWRKQRLRPIDEAILAHDFLLAIRLCEQGAAANADDALLFLRVKTHLLLRVADWVGARDLCRELLATQNLPWARMALGKALFHLNEYDEAQTLFYGVIAEHELVMEAYDWLARIQSAQGEDQAALATLELALRKSPYVITRQREVGDLAVQTGDLATAEAALAETVRLGKYSFWRDPADYGRLAQVQLARSDPGAARRTVMELRREFKQPVDGVLADALDADIWDQLGDTPKARQHLEQAILHYEGLLDPPSSAVALAMTASCIRQQRFDVSEKIARTMLRNRHDDSQLNQRMLALFSKAGREEVAERLIADVANSIVELNNEAVRLAQEGELGEAAERFVRAVKDMPANVMVLLNAINALLAFVNRNGWHETYMDYVADYLNRVVALEPENGRALQLAEIYRRTRARFGVA